MTLARPMMTVLMSIAALGCATVSAAEGGKWVVGVSGGTLGIGPEIGYRYGEHVGVRANAGFFNYSHSEDIDDIDYDGKLKLNSVGLLADWYPFGGGFRISVGGRSDSNKVRLHAVPTQNVEIGDTTYTPAQVGTLDGNVTFKSLVPSLTLGYGGKLAEGFTLGFEAGVLFQGSPRIDLTSTGGTLSGNAAFQAELAKERQQAEDDADQFKFWPVIQIHFLYRF